MEKLCQHARVLNPDLKIFVTSVRTGEGVEEAAAWIRGQREVTMA